MNMFGAPIVWILISLGVVAIVIFFERLMDFRRAKIDHQDFLKGVINILDSGNDAEALAICEDTTAPVAAVVGAAITNSGSSARVLRDAVDSQGRAEIGRLDRRMASLAIIAQIAPLLGLLGTVIGFVDVVLKIDSAGVVSRVDLINGSMSSLLVAALGLAISIVVTVMYGALRVRLERTVVDLESAASQIVGYISSRKEVRS